MHTHYRWIAVFLALASFIPLAVADETVTPVFYEGFTGGSLDGPVGKAGSGFSTDTLGVLNTDRGTLAFFVQPKSELKETEWAHIASIGTHRNAGYWSMGITFSIRRQAFLFNFFDAGAYAPPLPLKSVVGRWKPGQWHHLAAVWDRDQGIRVFEDGKLTATNWGEYRWQWNLIPRTFSIGHPVDEVCLFAEPLTDAQVAALARGEKPNGAPVPLAPPESRRERDLARMGWTGISRANLPEVHPDRPVKLAFARINQCVDAKRPVAYPYEGLLRSPWPGSKYGPSIRGQQLAIRLDPGSSYDRVRLFATRHFQGRLARRANFDQRAETVLDFDVPHAMFWHAQLPEAIEDTELLLKRRAGIMGQIDFYRVEPFEDAEVAGSVDYTFAAADSFPDTDQGATLQAEVPRRFWNPLRAVGRAAPAWTLDTPAFGGFQAIAEPPSEALGCRGVQVELVVDGLNEPTPVRIEVKEPVDTERVWLAGDVVLQPGASKKQQRFVIRLTGRPVIHQPPMKVRKRSGRGAAAKIEEIELPGVGISLKLTAGQAVRWVMGKGGSTLKLLTAEIDAVVEKAADDQVEWMREAYAELMEGHAYGDPRLQKPLVWLAHFAPKRMPFRQMWERVDGKRPDIVGIDVPPLTMPVPNKPAGVPDWAFWQMRAVSRLREHVHWNIDHKQVRTGEYGGVWNDDSTHVENWIGYMLCLDGSGKIHRSMRRYWDGLWQYQLDDGVGKYTQDAGHYSEEGTSGLGMRLLVDYGDPVAYARTLAAARHVKHWIADDPQGGYIFKSHWVGPEGVWTEGAFTMMKKSAGHQTDILVPLGYLTWYNRHPRAADYLIGLEAKAGPFFGLAHDHLTDLTAAEERYRESAVQPLGRYGPRSHIPWINQVGVSDAIRAAHRKEYQPLPPLRHYWASLETDQHWFDWKITGDDRFLVDSYKGICQWFYSHDWLNGPAQPSMDRNPLPRGSVIRSRIGALAANRGSSGLMWPQHAISYTKGADEVAALVTENLPNQFTTRFYPMTDDAHPVQLRVWRCHGTFDVTLAADDNDDGQPEETLWQKRMALDRGAYLDFTLPPGQASILSVRPVKTASLDFDKPDPAIGHSSIELVYGEHLVVRVYNNGTRPVDDVLVRVRDGRTGRVVINGEKHTGPIEAPLDLKPRFKTVEVKNIDGNAWSRIVVEIDPEKKIDDLNRHNNRAVLNYRGTFKVPRGWK